MKEEAIKLAKRGFKILPCEGKIAKMKDWPNKATSDIEAIKNLLSGEENIAILTGDQILGGFLTVIDCDIKENTNGIINFSNFLKEKNIILPDTLVATTGGGGKHYYFLATQQIDNSIGKLCPAVDIRGKNGYVIAPPSLHENGKRYQWENDLPIAKLPKELEEILVGKAISAEKRDLTYCIHEGNRNNTLFRLACKLVNTGLAKESIIEAIKKENQLRCIPPLAINDIENLVNSAYKYHTKKEEITSMSKIYSGKYKPASIAIYWLIWTTSLFLDKDTVYISQKDIAKLVGLTTTDSVRDNIKPLINDGIIFRERVRNYKGAYSVYSYRIL